MCGSATVQGRRGGCGHPRQRESTDKRRAGSVTAELLEGPGEGYGERREGRLESINKWAQREGSLRAQPAGLQGRSDIRRAQAARVARRYGKSCSHHVVGRPPAVFHKGGAFLLFVYFLSCPNDI